jgi:hypothetical protein
VLSVRDHVLSEKEAHFGHLASNILRTGLALIIFSGAGAILFHIALAQGSIIASPAFLFKWLLIAIALCVTTMQGRIPYPRYLGEGFAAANWYALLAVHMLAPVTSWIVLIVSYAVGVTAFMLIWSVLMYFMRDTSKEAHRAPAVKPVEVKKSAPVIMPKPVAAPPVQPPAPVAPPAVRQIPHIVVPQEPAKQAIASVPPAPMPRVPQVAPAAPLPKPVPHISLPKDPVPQKPHPLPEVLSSHAAFAAPPKPSAVPAALKVPVKPVSVPQKPAASAMKVPQKPLTTIKEDAHDLHEAPELPAIRVMPRTPEELQFQYRPSTVQFNQL